MDRKIRGTDLLLISAAGYGVMSGSILLMPLSGLGSVPGLLFWLGFLVGMAGQLLLSKQRKSAPADQQPRGKLPGMFVFFSGRAAKAVDTALAVLVILTAIVLAGADEEFYGCYVLLAATVFAFSLHCMINGKNYSYTMKQATRKPKETSKKKGGTVEK